VSAKQLEGWNAGKLGYLKAQNLQSLPASWLSSFPVCWLPDFEPHDRAINFEQGANGLTPET
jgi:hypothetical protein